MKQESSLHTYRFPNSLPGWKHLVGNTVAGVAQTVERLIRILRRMRVRFPPPALSWEDDVEDLFRVMGYSSLAVPFSVSRKSSPSEEPLSEADYPPPPRRLGATWNAE